MPAADSCTTLRGSAATAIPVRLVEKTAPALISKALAATKQAILHEFHFLKIGLTPHAETISSTPASL